MSKYFHKKTCRLCGDSNLSLVLSLGETPLANSFVRCEDIDSNKDFYPLDVFLCESCGHAQLLDVVDPKQLFDNYLYVSGTSSVFVQHFKDYAKQVKDRSKSQDSDLVVDIGSNDGTLLKQFKDINYRILGVDPAANLVSKANSIGIPTIQGFFTSILAEEIYDAHGAAKVITANNVFAHADDLDEIILGVKKLLDSDGMFVFEVSYLLDVIEGLLFDTIYHEHLSYHSLTPLLYFFQKHDMKVFDVERVDTHGGSIRCYVQHLNGPHSISKSVNSIVKIEQDANLFNKDTFLLFEQNIMQLRFDLRKILYKLKKQGKKIVGFGAPAKATTLMHYFNIDGSIIDYIVDDSKLKQNMCTPGYHIPIFETDRLYTDKPDYVLILAWNFSKFIIEKHSQFLEAGGHFITPLPKIQEI
jgi:SAM-dependent methyltransferase